MTVDVSHLPGARPDAASPRPTAWWAGRRRLLASGAALMLSSGLPAARGGSPAGESGALPAADLAALLAQAGQRHEPLLIFFSREGCVWCEALRREQWQPLASSAATRRIIMLELRVSDSRRFESGPAILGAGPSVDSAAGLARLLRIRLTPTVVFLGPQGEIADRLAGYPSRDFYGAYLDERIERAQAALRGRAG